MKQLITIMMVLGMMSLGACKEKKQAEEIVATKYVPKKPGKPVSMQQKLDTQTLKWMGAAYQVEIMRMAVDSLPMVANEIGQKFIDNRIRLSVKRADGSVFFEKSFTKASFMSYLTSDYCRDGLLVDMRFKEVRGNELAFVVTIATPEATDDEFLPLELSVDKGGGISIKVDNDMDFLAGDETDFDEGV